MCGEKLASPKELLLFVLPPTYNDFILQTTGRAV
jgi:hypothetical protein